MDTERRILEKFIGSHTHEAVHLIENLENEEIAALLESIPIELSAQVVSSLDRYKAVKSMEKMELGKVVDLMEQVPIPVAELLLRQMDDNLGTSLLEGLPEQTSVLLRRILKYPKSTVGAYVEPKVFTLPDDIKLNEALDRIKMERPSMASHIVVLGRDQSLSGVVELKDLVLTLSDASIQTVVNNNPPKILADLNIQVLLDDWDWDNNYTIMPVVDVKNIFIGVLTRETLRRISPKTRVMDRQAVQAGAALGDLYRIGLTGLFSGVAETPK